MKLRLSLFAGFLGMFLIASVYACHRYVHEAEVPQTPDGILSEVKRLVPKIEDSRDRDVIMIGMAHIQARMGDYQGVRESVSQIKLNQFMYIESILIDALISAEQIEEAKQAGEEFKDEAIRGRVLTLVAEAYARNGRVEEALQIATGIDQKYDMYNVYGLIASAQVQAGNLDGALKTLSKFFDSQDYLFGEFGKGSSVRAIVKPMAETGKVKGALDFTSAIKQLYGRDYGLWGVVQGQLAAGDLEGAIATAKLISSPTPKAFALHDIAEVEIKTGKREDAIKRLQEAAGIGKESSNEGGVLFYIANLQARAGDVEHALQSAAIIQHGEARHLALGAILENRAEAGDIKGVRKTIAVLHDNFGDADKDLTFSLPDESGFLNRSSTVEALIRAHLRAGDIDGAWQLASTLKNGEGSGGLMDIAHAYVDAGDMTEALQIAGEIKSAHLRDYALKGIAIKLAKAGHVSDSLKIISQMQGHGIVSKATALHDLAKIQMEKDGREGNFEWVGKVEDPYQHASALLGMASGMIKKESPINRRSQEGK